MLDEFYKQLVKFKNHPAIIWMKNWDTMSTASGLGRKGAHLKLENKTQMDISTESNLFTYCCWITDCSSHGGIIAMLVT